MLDGQNNANKYNAPCLLLCALAPRSASSMQNVLGMCEWSLNNNRPCAVGRCWVSVTRQFSILLSWYFVRCPSRDSMVCNGMHAMDLSLWPHLPLQHRTDYYYWNCIMSDTRTVEWWMAAITHLKFIFQFVLGASAICPSPSPYSIEWHPSPTTFEKKMPF